MNFTFEALQFDTIVEFYHNLKVNNAKYAKLTCICWKSHNFQKKSWEKEQTKVFLHSDNPW